MLVDICNVECWANIVMKIEVRFISLCFFVLQLLTQKKPTESNNR